MRWRRGGLLTVLALGAAACSLGGCGEDRASPDKPSVRRPPAKVGAASPQTSIRRPNIVLVTLESLRADHVGCYGYRLATTPTLDALAREGIAFESAHSVTSWTLTSHATLFTGLYPTAHQVDDPNDRLDDSYHTLAETLRGAGYQTAAVISGPFLRRRHNLSQGFEVYEESPASVHVKLAGRDVTNPAMERHLKEFLRRQRRADRPFFLFAYFWDPHYDYIPPAPYDTMFVPPEAEPIDLAGYETRHVVGPDISPQQLAYVISQYDGEIRCTDDLLGRLFDVLRELGLWEETAVIITADHGEEFFEHGGKGHKRNLYVESLHVPLVIKPPGKTPPRRDSRVVNLVDVFPTVLELAGAAAKQPVHGRSLLVPPPAEPAPAFFELLTTWYVSDPSSESDSPRKLSDRWLAVRRGDFKLVIVKGRDRWELYDLAKDPAEQSPLPNPTSNTQALELRRVLESYLRKMETVAADRGPASPARFTPEEIERLRALGYVGRSEEDATAGQ